MMIKSTIFGFLGLIVLIISTTLYGQRGLFIGTIQFPNSLSTVPNIRVYYAGQKIVCETNDDTKKVIFSIPELKERGLFYLLICPEIEFCSHENTVPFLKLKRGSTHKFYLLQRVVSENKNKKNKQKTNLVEYGWVVKEFTLDLPDGRIPDDTIIVQYHPDYIQAIEGGNAIEFPKIIIKNDILTIVGSEQKFHNLCNSWFLSALNTDTIHGSLQQDFLNTQSKTILAMAT